MTADRLAYLRDLLAEKLSKVPDFHDTFLVDDNDRIFWVGHEDGEIVVITLSPGRIVEFEVVKS